MSLLLLLLGCAPDPDDLACRDGFVRAPDGHCYPPGEVDTDPSLTEALDALSCERLRPGSGIDLEGGCAGGLCAGDLYDLARLVLDGEPTCTLGSGDQYCMWPNGVEGRWDDDDGIPGPDPAARNQRTHVLAPFVETSPSGLGVWVPVGCFIDVLGEADTTTLIDTDEGLFIESLDYDAFGLLAYDFRDMKSVAGPDGRIDDLYLYGAP